MGFYHRVLPWGFIMMVFYLVFYHGVFLDSYMLHVAVLMPCPTPLPYPPAPTTPLPYPPALPPCPYYPPAPTTPLPYPPALPSLPPCRPLWLVFSS